MKILLTSPEQSSISGQPIYVKNLAKGLKELGHEVHCLEMPDGGHCDLAIVNDFYPDVLDKFTANKIYNFCHSKEDVDRPIDDTRIDRYLAPRQQVADHWSKDFEILPIPIDFKKFDKAKKQKTKRYTVLIPCSITQARQAMVYNILQRAKENPKMDFIFRATNQGRFLHLAPKNVKFLPKTETLEEDMANADEVAGIFIGTITLEAWAMGLKTSVYDENGMWDYVKPPKGFEARHNYLNVAKKLIEMAQEKYSVIIPTMWASEKIERMIKVYDKSDHIGEVIIIDNKPEDKRKIKSKKIRYISEGKNIYVNPAWNWGIKEAKYNNVIIANDDVYFDNLDELLDKITLKKGMMIGPYKTCYNSGEKNLAIKEIPENHVNKFLTWGYGTFMIMRKDSYIQIPEELLIWEGDIIQARNNQTFCFTGIPIETEMSETIKKYDMKGKGYEDLAKRHKYPELFKLSPLDKGLMFPNENITFIIKTFKRYQCLTRLLISIKQFYPKNNIIIVDDNDDPEFKAQFYLKWTKRLNIQVIRLPFDSGLSMGRNEAVRNAKTPFILLLDDDFIFTPATDINKFYKVISSNNKIGIVGGICQESGQDIHYEFKFKFENGILEQMPDGDEWETIGNVKAKKTHCVLNFALFRKEVFDKITWDNDLKIAEHTDFYLRLRNTDWQVYFTPEVKIIHAKIVDGDYKQYRQRSLEFVAKMFKKNGIKKQIALNGTVSELIGDDIKKYRIFKQL